MRSAQQFHGPTGLLWAAHEATIRLARRVWRKETRVLPDFADEVEEGFHSDDVRRARIADSRLGCI
jgi:hypothetical protein